MLTSRPLIPIRFYHVRLADRDIPIRYLPCTVVDRHTPSFFKELNNMDRESLYIYIFYFLNIAFDFPITEEFKRKVDNILDLGEGSLLPSLISQNGFIGGGDDL